MKKAIIVTFFILYISTLNAQNENEVSKGIHDSIRNLKSEIGILKYEFEIIKRDKLNYNIEKDLLKESFSSNLQVINIVMAAILLFFSIFGGIFGYVGFKNILEIKKNFENELGALSKLKISYEKRFSALITREKVFNARMTQIEKTNETQTKKIRILELKNSIKEAKRNKNYNHAIQLINVGLEEEPNDYDLNAIKSDCYMYLKNYRMALESTLKTLEIAKILKKDMIIVNVYNLLEFSLFIKDVEHYNKHKQNNIEHLKYSTINVYLDALALFINKELDNLTHFLTEYLNSYPKMQVFPNWTFEGGRYFVDKEKNNTCFEIFNDYIDTIDKKMDIASFIEKYQK